MTTKFLDNKICTFNALLPWRFPRKTAISDDFLSAPKHPPRTCENVIFIVVSPSLRIAKEDQGVWDCFGQFWDPKPGRPREALSRGFRDWRASVSPDCWVFRGVPQALHVRACLKHWFWILMPGPDGLASLIFLSFLFRWKKKRKATKKKDFLFRRPLRSLGKKGKIQKSKDFLARE